MAKLDKDIYFTLPDQTVPYPVQYRPVGATPSQNKKLPNVRLTSANCKECGAPGWKLEKVDDLVVNLTSTNCKECGAPGWRLRKTVKPCPCNKKCFCTPER